MPERALRPPIREAILDAAIATLARNPASSLSDIATRAGVGRASLHRYFPSRRDLIAAVAQQCMDEMDAALERAFEGTESARERLGRLLEAIIPLGDRYHFLAMEVFDDQDLQERHEADVKWLGRLVDELKEEGVVAADFPRAWAVANIDAQVWLAWSEVAKGKIARANAAELVLRTLLEGMGPR